MKCPKCNKNIEHLLNVTSGFNTYELFPGGQYDQINDFEPDHNINDFRCPECDAILFKDETEAIEFLTP